MHGTEFNAFGAVSVIAEFLATHFVVVGIGAFKPTNFGVTFKGEDVRCDSVKEPTVVGDDHSTTTEVLDAFF